MPGRSFFAAIALLLLLLLAGCGGEGSSAEEKAPELEGLTFLSEAENRYAEGFHIYSYEGGYKAIRTESGRLYLVVPEEKEAPADLPEGVTVLKQPLDEIYLAASSAMALFDALDALDAVAFSGTDSDGWYVENAKEAMEQGDILFAGKYSQPDYESLLQGGCDLAVESMMILHTPETKEKLEQVGIPVFIDESSTESHPLGRTEWIRVYGTLLGREEAAEAFFDDQSAILKELSEVENTGKTVAFFFVNQAGSVVVRRTEDYIPRMIALAGGNYIFDDLKGENEDSASGSVTISMEEFYAAARDADYLVYNGTIDDPLGSIADLTEKSAVFADFRAVKEGNVYTTSKYMYQATDIMGELISDFHRMLTGDTESMVFLSKVE